MQLTAKATDQNPSPCEVYPHWGRGPYETLVEAEENKGVFRTHSAHLPSSCSDTFPANVGSCCLFLLSPQSLSLPLTAVCSEILQL